MVRLKENIVVCRKKNKDISIPYGAIKRNSFILSFAGLVVFQFLMVRLKDKLKRISRVKVFPFQFLMVRLKVSSPSVHREFNFKFQFLMVRLKAKFSIIFFVSNLISIPYGAIKRI